MSNHDFLITYKIFLINYKLFLIKKELGFFIADLKISI